MRGLDGGEKSAGERWHREDEISRAKQNRRTKRKLRGRLILVACRLLPSALSFSPSRSNHELKSVCYFAKMVLLPSFSVNETFNTVELRLSKKIFLSTRTLQ